MYYMVHIDIYINYEDIIFNIDIRPNDEPEESGVEEIYQFIRKCGWSLDENPNI